jgi:site-specific recombinase XerD
VARVPRKRRAHRPHKPTEIGPRTFARGRWQWVDLRPFGGKREPIRDPKHPNWPATGDRTTDPETAQRWAWAYLDHLRVDAKVRHLGLRGPAKPLGTEAHRFLAHLERTRSVKTSLNAHAALAVHLVPYLGAAKPVDTIHRDTLQGWADHLVSQGYAIGTVGAYLTCAGTFFRWRSAGKHVPTDGVVLPDPGERDVEPWSDEDLTCLREAADTLDRKVTAKGRAGPPITLQSYRLLMELAIGTGCRVAELGALEWSAFNAADRTVRVRWQVPPDGYGAALQPLKGRRNRTALVLPSWWEWHQGHRKGRVILAPNVLRVAHRSLERWCEQIIEQAGLKRDRQNAHSFRHTYARIALESGARLEELQRFLGHASIKTTEQSYGWLTEQSAATLARARIYGEGLRVIPGGKRHKKRHSVA